MSVLSKLISSLLSLQPFDFYGYLHSKLLCCLFIDELVCLSNTCAVVLMPNEETISRECFVSKGQFRV